MGVVDARGRAGGDANAGGDTAAGGDEDFAGGDDDFAGGDDDFAAATRIPRFVLRSITTRTSHDTRRLAS